LKILLFAFLPGSGAIESTDGGPSPAGP
jgi:hypothetical protein